MINNPEQVPQICIKIMVYDKCHVEEVVYYRNKLPMWIVEQWKWYFEYVAARIKVRHPRRKVELVICAQTLLQGEEYIAVKSASFLKAKKGQLKRLSFFCDIFTITFLRNRSNRFGSCR